MNDGFSPNRPTVLITGSNRGLGLEFARQYADQGWNVIATCRAPAAAAALQEIAGHYLMKMSKAAHLVAMGTIAMPGWTARMAIIARASSSASASARGKYVFDWWPI
jgi:NAD(P)-dependent dehydrogenase (short-subunit alcohol dehydrogenase family)